MSDFSSLSSYRSNTKVTQTFSADPLSRTRSTSSAGSFPESATTRSRSQSPDPVAKRWVADANPELLLADQLRKMPVNYASQRETAHKAALNFINDPHLTSIALFLAASRKLNELAAKDPTNITYQTDPEEEFLNNKDIDPKKRLVRANIEIAELERQKAGLNPTKDPNYKNDMADLNAQLDHLDEKKTGLLREIQIKGAQDAIAQYEKSPAWYWPWENRSPRLQ